MAKFSVMQNQTIIFIPGICGFTEFVNQTAIEFCQNIISELLEIIIDTNNLGLTISEIEGDAELFYKKNEIPSSNQTIQLSEEMFLPFHDHLNEIESNNVYQCGDCKSASLYRKIKDYFYIKFLILGTKPLWTSTP